MTDPVITIHPPPKIRRTPRLTAMARELFERELLLEGWQPGGTIPKVAKATGLTVDQVRDAIFAPSADDWRHAMTARIRNLPLVF